MHYQSPLIKSLSLLFTLADCHFITNGGPAYAQASEARSAETNSAAICGTFSIVAYDPETQELGVAVHSRVVAVGSIVPFAKAGVGAIATQSLANVTYGPRGLALLEEGLSAEDVLAQLLESDDDREFRQVGIIAADGTTAQFTGSECLEWAGGRSGENYCVQGNILAGEEVVDAMAEAFENTEGELADRLLAALDAGDAAGGDTRGKQAAALLIVREGWGYAGLNDRYRDIRVGDHPDPIVELRRVYEVHKSVFGRPE
jgi:uncharacterized Ntn-hydrolase superfamily protein